MLGKFSGRSFAELARHAPIEANPRTLDIGAGRFPDFQRARIIAKLETDFLDYPVGLILELVNPLLAEKFVIGNLPFDVGRGFNNLTFTGSATSTAWPCPGLFSLWIF